MIAWEETRFGGYRGTIADGNRHRIEVATISYSSTRGERWVLRTKIPGWSRDIKGDSPEELKEVLARILARFAALVTSSLKEN